MMPEETDEFSRKATEALSGEQNMGAAEASPGVT